MTTNETRARALAAYHGGLASCRIISALWNIDDEDIAIFHAKVAAGWALDVLGRASLSSPPADAPPEELG